MFCNKIKIFLFSLFISISGFVSAVTYYVSSTGTGTGTISSPMSFSTAIGKALTGGDSVILRGGTYSFSAKQTISKSGSSSSSLLHVVAYKSEVPILDFRTQAYGTAGLSLSGSYVHLKGITVQGAGDNGFYVTGNYNVLEFCVARWNCDSGFQMKTGSDNSIINCDSYENFDYETGGISSPNFGGNADGFADKQYTNTGTNHYKGCRSWRNSDDGWDHYEKIGNTTYDSCWCYANGPASYDMKTNIRFKTDSASWFVNFSSTNYVVTNYGNGNGFKLGGNYTAHNGTLHDCISVMNTVKGFDQNNDNGTMTVYNCTGYANNPDYGFSNSSYGTLIVKNCATLSSKSTNKLACKSVTQSNNSWNTGFSCTSSDFQSVDYSQMLNARKADGSLPEITFLHLKSTSAMIDKGLNLGYTYKGAAPDLGAFEYLSATSAVEVLKNDLQIESIYLKSEHTLVLKGLFANIEVYDIAGRKVLSENEGNETCSVSTLRWNNGVYLVKVETKEGKIGVSKVLIY